MAKANIDSVDVIKNFRTALWRFAEIATAALAEGEGEVHRTMIWLETEQESYWEGQIRKRHDEVERWKEKYREKTLYKDAAGTRSSGFDEKKALQKAQKRLEDAEVRYKAVRKNILRLQKELHSYTGSVQHFATDVINDIPNMVARLDKMAEQLGNYVALAAPETVTSQVTGSDAAGSMGQAPGDTTMARGTGEARTPAPAPPAEQGSAGETGATTTSYRARTPAAEARASADPLPAAYQLATTKPLNGPQRLAVASTNVKHRPPDPEHTLVVADDLRDPGSVYLHHTEPAGPTDTGWFVGPSDPGVPLESFKRVRVAQLLQVRPDLREVLALPQGFIVIMGPAGITSILNPKDEDVWQRGTQRK
jgi:hypothetical protein